MIAQESKRQVFVIEDEQDIAELIRYNLVLNGHNVQTFSSGEDGINAISKLKPDLLVLDIMLPGLSGLEICEKLKKEKELKSIPIIMVSAKGEEADIIKGLEMGADDYVTKPFSTSVLNARVEAVLRRGPYKKIEDKEQVSFNGIELHTGRVEVLIDNQPIDLTQTEFKILHFLIQRPGWVFTRNQIVEGIRGVNYAVTERSIDFQMVGLRKKMGPKGDYIETVRGVGYRFKSHQ